MDVDNLFGIMKGTIQDSPRAGNPQYFIYMLKIIFFFYMNYVFFILGTEIAAVLFQLPEISEG